MGQLFLLLFRNFNLNHKSHFKWNQWVLALRHLRDFGGIGFFWSWCQSRIWRFQTVSG